MKTFIAISGSLRKDSFNTKLLNTLKGLAPEDVSIEVVEKLAKALDVKIKDLFDE